VAAIEVFKSSGTPVDTTPPAAPVINQPANNSYDTDGNVTVSGTAEANSTVELFEGTTSEGTATASANGAWSITLENVAEGPHSYTAKAKDAANNVSPASNALTIIVDKSAPTVTGKTPEANAERVAVGTDVTATFSEAMDAATLNDAEGNGNFTLVRSGTTTPVTASVTYVSGTKTVTLDPASNLNEGATYTATITTQAKDASGNALANNETWTFTTAISAPSNLLAKLSGAGSKQRIDLSWNDNSSVENRYVIERSTTSNFMSNLVTREVGANVRTYRDDTAVARTTTYYYRVYAVSSTGVKSDNSNVRTVTTKK
jgi:hypothetical protein